MKKEYISPAITVIDMDMQALMNATSMQNEAGDVQIGIKEDSSAGFEAGAGGNDGSFDLWDE